VKILIEMAPEHYNGLLNACRDAWLSEYNILKKGVVVRQGNRRQILIPCEKHQAHHLLVVARSLKSPAVEDIRIAIDFPLDN
jgi:hypothetical protein